MVRYGIRWYGKVVGEGLLVVVFVWGFVLDEMRGVGVMSRWWWFVGIGWIRWFVCFLVREKLKVYLLVRLLF